MSARSAEPSAAGSAEIVARRQQKRGGSTFEIIMSETCDEHDIDISHPDQHMILMLIKDYGFICDPN